VRVHFGCGTATTAASATREVSLNAVFGATETDPRASAISRESFARSVKLDASARRDRHDVPVRNHPSGVKPTKTRKKTKKKNKKQFVGSLYVVLLCSDRSPRPSRLAHVVPSSGGWTVLGRGAQLHERANGLPCLADAEFLFVGRCHQARGDVKVQIVCLAASISVMPTREGV